MYNPLIPPAYHASSFVGSTSMCSMQASPIGRTTLPQLKPATCCGGMVTTGTLNGHVAAVAGAAARAMTNAAMTSPDGRFIRSLVRLDNPTRGFSRPLLLVVPGQRRVDAARGHA